MEIRRAFRVTGRVQGVGYRWWTKCTADALGIRGTVRNTQDGAVEVHAVGDSAQLERFEAQLQVGPEAALVQRVEALEFTEFVPEVGFEICV